MMVKNAGKVSQKSMKKFWLGFFVCTLIGILYFVYLFYSENAYFPSFSNHLPYLMVSIFVVNIIGFMVYQCGAMLNRWLPWKEYLAARFFVGMVLNILIALVVMLLIGWVFTGLISDNFDLKSTWNLHYENIIRLLIITVITILLYSLIYFALFSYNQYTVVQIESLKNERNQLRLQLEILKSQLSPHYLFNSLNTISSLLFKDATLAEDFIRRLAQTYQYILNNNKKTFVRLEEEIEFVKSYNYLLKVRFENNLHLEINLPGNIMHTKIPPLTLQMLVENAVKHNIINKKQPLYIYIGAVDNTHIRISNTKTQFPGNVHSFHVGLENIKQRYSYFTRLPIKVEDTGKFTVSLPVIKDEVKNANNE